MPQSRQACRNPRSRADHPRAGAIVYVAAGEVKTRHHKVNQQPTGLLTVGAFSTTIVRNLPYAFQKRRRTDQYATEEFESRDLLVTVQQLRNGQVDKHFVVTVGAGHGVAPSNSVSSQQSRCFWVAILPRRDLAHSDTTVCSLTICKRNDAFKVLEAGRALFELLFI